MATAEHGREPGDQRVNTHHRFPTRLTNGLMVQHVKRLFRRAKSLLFRYAWDALFLDPRARDRETISRLPLFAPNAAGPLEAQARLTLLSANQTFPFLVHFLTEVGRPRLIELTPPERLCSDPESWISASCLKQLFDEHGSDKASAHDYHYIYGRILRDVASVTALLEIGIGTNRVDVVSNMGRTGTPGASLRAFRDYLPNATIYGGDIDRRILFDEERIQTFFVDQTDLGSLEALGAQIGHAFDLIIDDGLHAPSANIAVLAFAVTRLKPGGWVVVEDIAESAIPVWQVIAALLPATYEAHLIAARGGVVFAVRWGDDPDGRQ